MFPLESARAIEDRVRAYALTSAMGGKRTFVRAPSTKEKARPFLTGLNMLTRTGELAITPVVVPVLAMTPISVAVPVTASGIETVNHETRGSWRHIPAAPSSGDSGRRGRGESDAASLPCISRRSGRQGHGSREGECNNSLHRCLFNYANRPLS